MYFATTKKFSINEESPHFLTFSAKRHKDKIDGKLGNGHGKVTEKILSHEKCDKSVGTLLWYPNEFYPVDTFSHQEELAAAGAALYAGQEAGWLRPVVGEDLALDRAPEAHREVLRAGRGTAGRIVLSL